MPSCSPRLRAILPFALLVALLAAPPAAGQAVLGPTEDATVAPVGVWRMRIANSWTNGDEALGSVTAVARSHVQVRFTTLTAELGVRPRLSLLAIVPEAGTLATSTWYSYVDAGLRADSMVPRSHDGIGDIELAAKYSWLAGPGERERIALPPGLRVRSSVSASYRLATGSPDDPTDPFDVGTGAARRALTVSSQTDFLAGRYFWVSAVARYGWPAPVTRPVQVRPPGDPLSTAYPLIEATQTAGNFYSLELTPRVVLGRYFSVGAQYAYVRQDASTFSGSLDTTIAGVPVTIDAATLGPGSAGTAQYVSGTFAYSTVAAYLQGKSSLPIELSYQHTAAIKASGAIPAATRTDIMTIRLWVRLWGATWTREKPPATDSR